MGHCGKMTVKVASFILIIKLNNSRISCHQYQTLIYLDVSKLDGIKLSKTICDC